MYKLERESTRPIRVLQVDDDREFAELTATFLERKDDRFTVETATSASDGLEVIAADEFDCVISDHDMPRQSGVEFLETVREEHPDLPFILYTGKGSEEIASDAISAGVTDYLQKERNTDQFELLANRIQNAVAQSRAEQQVVTTQRRLRELSEATDDILWMVAGDWSEFLFVNSAYEDIWGRPRDVLYDDPMDFMKGVHPEDQNLVTTSMEQVSNGEPVNFEFRVNADEDFQRWVWVQAEPLHGETDDPARIAGFVRDITERKEREQELQETRDRMEFALNATDAVVWAWDVETDQTTFYPSEEALYGTTVDTREDFIDVIHPDDRQQVCEALEHSLETGEPKYEEVRIIRDARYGG